MDVDSVLPPQPKERPRNDNKTSVGRRLTEFGKFIWFLINKHDITRVVPLPKQDCNMKKFRVFVLMLIASAMLAFTPGTSHADDYVRGQTDNPFRIVAYGVHAVGTAFEWVVTRPVHWVVSRPHARIIFGHTVNPDDVYFSWDEYQ
jgi:hypothetical protein